MVTIKTSSDGLEQFLTDTGELFEGRFNSPSLQFSSITPEAVAKFIAPFNQEACEHTFVEVEGGIACEDCDLFVETCYTCGHAPCDCDAQYDAYRDRELERELE